MFSVGGVYNKERFRKMLDLTFSFLPEGPKAQHSKVLEYEAQSLVVPKLENHKEKFFNDFDHFAE